jgi:hypothetical protein
VTGKKRLQTLTSPERAKRMYKVVELIESYPPKTVFEGTEKECSNRKNKLDKERSDFIKLYMQKCQCKNITKIEYRIF